MVLCKMIFLWWPKLRQKYQYICVSKNNILFSSSSFQALSFIRMSLIVDKLLLHSNKTLCYHYDITMALITSLGVHPYIHVLWHMIIVQMPVHCFIIGNNVKLKCSHINIILIIVAYLAHSRGLVSKPLNPLFF